jgi:hypothetical protein
MTRFVTKSSLLILCIAIIYALLGFLADGRTDPFYLRFTSKQKNSMILGTSRAAQGIVPKVVSKLISKEIEGNLFNYSFTVLHSPYGKTYFKAIQEKLDKNTKNGLFIVAVDPWSIAQRTDIDYFRETELELAKINDFNSYPNYNYLRNAYQNSFFSLIKNKLMPEENMILHEDGWLEVTIDVRKEMIEKGSKEKIKDYRTKQLSNYKISLERIAYLEKTIALLKKYGTVVLVRIPVDKRMLAIENELDPIFTERIEKIANKFETKFLSYKDENYVFPDGNHMYKESGKIFSRKLGADINKLFTNE